MKDPGILLKTEARYSSGVQQPTRPMAILSSQPHPYWPAQFAASRVVPVATDQKVATELTSHTTCAAAQLTCELDVYEDVAASAFATLLNADAFE
jgi:hypothetical protein